MRDIALRSDPLGKRRASLLGIALALSLILGATSHAQAQVSALHLEWEAPAGCPSRASLVSQLDALLGQPLEASTQEPMTIRASVSTRPERRGYELRLIFKSGRGQRSRRLWHDDCAKLTEAAALLIAMAVAPERLQLSERAPALVERPSPTPSQVDAIPRGPRMLRFGTAGYALVGTSALPGIGFGAEAELHATFRGSVRLAISGQYWAPRDYSLAQEAYAELWLANSTLRGCWLHGNGSWELATCLGLEVGALNGLGHGLDENHHARDRWSALLFEPRLSYRVASVLRLTLGIELHRALERPRFDVEGLDRAYRPSIWGVGGRAGLTFGFPDK